MARYISYSSAGHHKKDPGAIGVNNRKEADEAIIFRDLVNAELKKFCKKIVRDDDTETLGQYLGRINPVDDDAVVEFHFNAFANPQATGTEVLISDTPNIRSKAFAKELSDGTARILGLKNRGVKSESQSARGRLALMRKRGAVALMEICFITNPDDMRKYDAGKFELAKFVAGVIAKYDLN